MGVLSDSQMKSILLLLSFSTGLYGADQNLEVFVRSTPRIMISTGCGTCEATELWLHDKDKNSTELLLRGKEDPDITTTIAGISEPVFSLDMGSVYFVSEAWATSGTIQKIDLKSKKVVFLIDGNSVEIISTGPDKGMLLVDRALIKRDKNGASLGRDSYLWLVSADGKPVSEIGPSQSSVAINFKSLHSQASNPRGQT